MKSNNCEAHVTIENAKHSPLPWRIEDQGNGLAIYSEGGSHCVCFFNSTSRSTHAVARGISAQDEMRANVQLIIDALSLKKT